MDLFGHPVVNVDQGWPLTWVISGVQQLSICLKIYVFWFSSDFIVSVIQHN